MTSLGTVILFTERMAELADFYRQGLGLPDFQAAGPGHLGVRLGEVYFGLDQVDARPEGRGGTTLWWTVDDLQVTFDRLVSLGATVRQAPNRKPWGGFLAAVLDPDGNLVGLSQREASA